MKAERIYHEQISNTRNVRGHPCRSKTTPDQIRVYERIAEVDMVTIWGSV